jgi:hypothetical protein
MLDLLEFVIELICSWRIILSVLLTVAAIWLVRTYVPMFHISVAISILLGVVGIGGGFYWQCRADARERDRHLLHR